MKARTAAVGELESASIFLLGAIFGWMVLPIPFELWLCVWLAISTVALVFAKIHTHRARPQCSRAHHSRFVPTLRRMKPSQPAEVVEAIRSRYGRSEKSSQPIPVLPIHPTSH